MLTISRADNQPCMVAISHGGNQVGKESSREGQAGDYRPGRSRRATVHQCLEAAAPTRAQHLCPARVSTAHASLTVHCQNHTARAYALISRHGTKHCERLTNAEAERENERDNCTHTSAHTHGAREHLQKRPKATVVVTMRRIVRQSQ